MGAVAKVTDSDFATEVEQSSQPVLVDFWAEWCGPCKAMNPILDEFASQHEGTMRVAKLNIDENPEVTQRFRVMSIPTMLVFQNGEVVKQLVGAMPKARLERALDEFIQA